MIPLDQFDFRGGLTADGFRAFMVHCYRHNVSDIHLQSGGPLIVDHHGRKIVTSQFRLEHATLVRLIDEVYSPNIKASVMGGKGYDGPLQLEGDSNGRYGLKRGERVRFRSNFVQATIGSLSTAMAVTSRIIPTTIPPLDGFGLPDELYHSLLPQDGIGLVCGPTGSGKSTLLAATCQHYGKTHPDGKLVTNEDPVEYPLGGPDWLLQPQQCEVGRDIPSFSEGIRLAMRQAMDVICVGEIRDLLTLVAALACAQSGHLALSTLHAFSPGHAFSRSYLMAPVDAREQTAYDLLDTLRYVVVQRLLPTTDGRRQAVREYVLFDEALRMHLTAQPYTRWPAMINATLLERKTRIADQAWQLFVEERIDALVAQDVIGWAEFNRLTRRSS
ncbi:plasmid transfer ATPase TraJ [Dryocola clanedunensis]|uniref:plasmid transfer ATPase TraJ n=1 Tax=Cedecea sulfonylureivorans TaxID=3051154 RepID=UPI001925DB1E|nr:plasmid transfer ATPase TraJ [Cedecea sulfonylureivorans]